MAIAEPSKNWGFCQWDCSKDSESDFAIRPRYEDGNNMYLSDEYCKELIKVNMGHHE